MKVITHDGKFHPDEIFSIALLTLTQGINNKIEILRTRENLEKYTSDPNVIVIDVGGAYDPKMLNFDHHQASFNEKNEFGNLMSSFGLICKYLKDKGEIPENLIPFLDSFSNKVDMYDNGIKYFGELDFINTYNSFSIDFNEYDNFNYAINAACEYLKGKFNYEIDLYVKYQPLINDALENAVNGVIYAKEYIPITEQINKSDNLLLVYPHKGKTYITTLNDGETVDFSTRCPTPLNYRGVIDQGDIVYSSKSGHLTIVNANADKHIDIILTEFKKNYC